MKLINRHRSHRPKAPQIPLAQVTQEEIAADLHYPAVPRLTRSAAPAQSRGANR